MLKPVERKSCNKMPTLGDFFIFFELNNFFLK